MTTQDNNQEAREGGTISTVSFWKVASAYRHAQGDELLKAERALIDFIYGWTQAGAAVPKITREAFERWWATFGDPKLLLEPAWDALTKIITPAPTDTGAAGAGEVKGKTAAEWYIAYCETSEKLKAADGAIERYSKELADLRAQLALALQQRNQTLDELARAHAQLRQHQDSKPTDLSKRLRDASCNSGCTYANMTLFLQAADEIERLAAAQGEPSDQEIYDTLGLHGALPLKDGSPERIIKGRELVLIQAIRAILSKTYAASRLRDVRALALEGMRTIDATHAAQAVPGDEVRDSERLNRLDQWREAEAKRGFQWSSIHFDMAVPVREQLDVALDKADAKSATKTEGEEQQ